MIKISRGLTYRIAAVIFSVLLLVIVAGAQASSQSGNRIWDESKGMNNTSYTWNSYSFSGFYYSLDDNLSTEELTIRNIKRTINRGDIRYTTSPIEVSFDYSAFGKYQVIGFMADKFFAGYTSNSSISGNRAISTIGAGQLQKVLFDDEDRRTVYEGGTLTLKEGYVIIVKEVDIGGGPRQVFISLAKNGVEVDSDVIAAGDTYVYSPRVGTVSDLPIIAMHVESVFRGREANAAFIRGLFQISDTFTRVSTGDRYGVMEITGTSNDRITMENRDSAGLSAGSTKDLMGDLKIIVADDSNVLRFALSAARTGTYEVRGTIYPVTDEWTPLNFGLNVGGGASIGFFYDMDKDIGTENLKISTTGTSIPSGSLRYSTKPQEISFDYSPFGSYQVIGFMADKYFAGYSQNSSISGNKELSTIGNGQLHRVLLDDDNRRVAAVGGTITLKEGYVMKIMEVDVGAGPGQVWVSLLKNGREVDNSVVAGGNTYRYIKKVGTVSDLPLIVIRFESVFRGREVNAAFTRGIFQISETSTSVKGGDRYGQMQISNIGAGGIEMDNPSSVGISRGSTVDLMGNIKLKVADSSDVRFYPFVMVTPEMVASQLVIDAPPKAVAGDSVKITVTAGGNPVGGANVTVDSGAGETDANGVLNYMLPRTLIGTYNITATRLGYEKATRSIEVQGYTESMLVINVPAKANQFEMITISVTHNNTPVSGASVSYDNVAIGTTDSNGALSYTPQISGMHTISASKSGFATASRDIDVRMPYSEFRAIDINITPDVVFSGDSTMIRSRITNAGTKMDTLPVVLVVNSTEVGNQSVTLSPGEVKAVNFTYRVTLPAGNYTVAILGQSKSLEVKEAPLNIYLIIAIVIILIVAGAIVIYYYTSGRTKAPESKAASPGQVQK